jgi:histone-binding protein RBBP4
MAEEYETENEAEVEEEFSVWKRNTPLLYDLFISHPLAWPSLTVQWLPSSPQPHSHPSFNLHKLLLATHTSDEEPNYLMLAESSLPVNTSQPIVSEDPQNPILPKVLCFLMFLIYEYQLFDEITECFYCLFSCWFL